LHIPYKIDEDYFNAKYPNTAPIFIQWWKNLPGDIQKTVSPRRVDYAADAYSKGCRLEDFLPTESGVNILRTSLKSLPFHESIKNITDAAAAELFIRDVNNTLKLLDLVKVNDPAAIAFFTKYSANMPKELKEPFAEFVKARRDGFEVVSSIEELITKLSDDIGNQGTAAMINSVKLDILYRNGGSLSNDLLGLNVTKRNLVAKLANRCWDVVCNCQAKTLDRIFWGLEGKAAKHPSNFQEILVNINEMGLHFSHKQKTHMNEKLYSYKIVEDMNFL
jgi:hypothetical protein